jgi:hypothetical protein
MSERDDDPYRRGAAARPPALIALAEAAALPVKAGALSRDALLDRYASHRIAAALGVPLYARGAPTRRIASIAVLAACGGVLYATFVHTPYALGIAMAAITTGALALNLLRQTTPGVLHAEVARRFAGDVALPFPVTGYDAWLASEIPLIDVRVRGELDRTLVAGAARGVDRGLEVEWIDARMFRLATPPRRYGGGALVGDRALWTRLANEMLLPIHQDVGVDRVEMGGAMRALPPGLG